MMRVHFDMDAWCIITVCGVSAFTVDTKDFFTEAKWFSPGLFTWREGSQASRLTDAMGKGNFHIILFKTQRFFMLDKCVQKIKIHPMRSSGSHGICRIKVVMAVFHCQNCKQNENKIHALL